MRKLQKTLRIGILGALNGLRLRRWYFDETENIVQICRNLNVPFASTEQMNSDETHRLVLESRADLGLSLGNGFIGKNIFSATKHGMINIHGEILPRFRGAQSVIWPIHEGVNTTGFTIHQIDSQIDAGEILFQRQWPIVFGASLRETVERNVQLIRSYVPGALIDVCTNYEQLHSRAQSQTGGRTYTTPSCWQFLRMIRNNREMYEKSRRTAVA